MKPLVLVDAAPFCFGPVATTAAVLEQLENDDVRIMVLVSGTSAEFLRRESHPWTLVDCDTEDLDDLAAHRELISSAALFVCNTNPLAARFAIGCGVRVVYLDTLFWMWDEIDPLIAERAIYVAQDFAGVQAQLKRIGNKIADFRSVGPLIPPKSEGSGTFEDFCLVSFGGMSSRLTVPGVTNRYAWVMTRILLEVLQRRSFASCRFRGDPRVMDALRHEFAAPGLTFGFSPHHEHIHEMATAALTLLSPGLTGSYEAARVGARTCLLLPQNYSQHLQSPVFREEPWSFAGVDWRDVYPEFKLPYLLPEHEAVAQLNKLIRRFEEDMTAQRRYQDFLSKAIDGARRATFARKSGVPEAAAIVRGALGLEP